MAKRTYDLDEVQGDLRAFHDLTYPDGELVRFGDFGNLLKIGGVLVQGMGMNVVLLMPTACGFDVVQGIFAVNRFDFIKPTPAEWFDVLRRTDDPLVFEQDETGAVKAVHRKVHYAISGAVQQQIWARDGFRCMYCGQPMGKVQLTVDHFVPLELDGAQAKSNYISACRKCNKRKGKKRPLDYCAEEDLDYTGLRLYLKGKASAAFIAHLDN